ALTVEVLTRVGYAAIPAASGEEALKLARRQHPRVVVLEICLGEICGYEVCRTLRAEFGHDLSIIFLSATRTESFDRVAGLLIGADDYLVKPFAPDELVARVEALVRRGGPTQSVGGPSGLTRREQEVLAVLAEGLTRPRSPLAS